MNETVRPDQGMDQGSETSRIKNTPGMRLQCLRTERGLTQTQVAEALHLTVHYVNALEKDEYQKLPGKIFVKGYFRAYSELLGADADVIITSFEELCELREDYQVQQETSQRKRKGRDHSRFWMISAAILLITAVFASWWFWGRGQQAQAAVPTVVPDYISAVEAGLKNADAGLPVIAQEITVQNQVTADSVVQGQAGNIQDEALNPLATPLPAGASDISVKEQNEAQGTSENPARNSLPNSAFVVPVLAPVLVPVSVPAFESRPIVSTLEG